MHWSSWWHGGGMGIMWLPVLIMLGVVIYLVVRSQQTSGPPRETPEEILKRRFARGEIDREEYEQAMRDLRQL